MATPTTTPVTPLPICIPGTASLSPEAKAQIKALSGPRPLQFLGSALLSWTIIIGLIVGAEYVGNIALTIFVMFLIAGRQMALAYLMHEQTHHLGFNNKYGDLVVNLLACYPLMLITVEQYAQVHLTHHRHYFEPNDPDFNRKSGDIWAQPMPAKKLALLFLQDLLGFSVIKYFKGKKLDKLPHPRRWVIPAWIKYAYWFAFAVLFTWQGWWAEFLIYWLLPLFTFFQTISRLGALCEHRYNLPAASLEESTPMIILTWWQKALIPDLNFHYHIYHHYFPGVSFTSLPKVHKIFEREGLVDQGNVFRGYVDYFRRAIISRDARGTTTTTTTTTTTR